MKLGVRIFICVVTVILLGSLSGILGQASDRTWYDSLIKPPGTPPGWVFGPVWTALYAMMGTALALVWHNTSQVREQRIALRLFAIQMLLNLLWTPVFFRAQEMLLALVIIVALWVSIFLTIRAFSVVHVNAGRLMIPYLAWVSYATYLNAGFLALNQS
jgi:tryptophan-rich sensory protein